MVIPRTGVDPDGVARTEADHFGNCPVCGAFLDMRDLGQMLDHKEPLPHPAQDQAQ